MRDLAHWFIVYSISRQGSKISAITWSICEWFIRFGHKNEPIFNVWAELPQLDTVTIWLTCRMCLLLPDRPKASEGSSINIMKSHPVLESNMCNGTHNSILYTNDIRNVEKMDRQWLKVLISNLLTSSPLAIYCDETLELKGLHPSLHCKWPSFSRNYSNIPIQRFSINCDK